MNIINEIFNTREIATAILMLLFISFALFKNLKEIWSSLKLVLQTFFSKQIIRPLVIMFVYSLFLIYILNFYGFWENHQIKNYIFWLIGFGVLTHFQQKKYSIKEAFKNTLSLIVIFQFFLNLYTFNLIFELILISLITILTTLKLVNKASNDNEKLLNKFIDGLLSMIFIILLILTIREYLYNFNAITTSKTIYDFSIPTFLSIMTIPYFFLFFLYTSYESSFVSLKYSLRNKKYLRYAKFKGIVAFNFDSRSFQKWTHNLFTYDINKKNIIKSIQDIKKYNIMKKNIYDVDINKGWHPFVANCFLKDYDIQVDDYRRSYNDLWSGTSNFIKTYEENSDISYRIEGNLEYIYLIELKLFFYNRDFKNMEKSYSLFVNMCNDLSFITLGYELSDEILDSLINENNFSINFNAKTINITHKKFDTGAYKLEFIIS